MRCCGCNVRPRPLGGGVGPPAGLSLVNSDLCHPEPLSSSIKADRNICYDVSPPSWSDGGGVRLTRTLFYSSLHLLIELLPHSLWASVGSSTPKITYSSLSLHLWCGGLYSQIFNLIFWHVPACTPHVVMNTTSKESMEYLHFPWYFPGKVVHLMFYFVNISHNIFVCVNMHKKLQ